MYPSQTNSKAAGVICGTDFTPAAVAAAELAAALAKRWGVPLHLVHATVLPEYPPMLEELAAEADRLRRTGAEVHEAVLDGNADEAMVEFAKASASRLIVLSALGKRAPERWLLGSTSERTAERASIPTLVVRHAAPLLAWARGEKPLEVLAAFNQTPTSDAALVWTRELTSVGPCQLTVGYIDFPPDERIRLGGTGPLPLVGNPPGVQKILEQEIKARATELLGNGDFTTRVEANWGRPDAALAEMTAAVGADLLVVGSHQYHGFERLWHASISRGLLHHSGANILVVPFVTAKGREG